MFIRQLHIINYKNLEEVDETCSPGFNCFIGNNGMGKTNVLDAVYHLAMCKSYSHLPDSQNIRHGAPFFVIQGEFDRDGEVLDIYCGVKRGEKKVFKKNKKAYDRLSDHIGWIPLVMISPADSLLIDGGSEERRRFLDGVISQCDSVYLQQLIRYNRLIVQRNSLLRADSRRPDRDMLEVLDEQIATYGQELLRRREAFVAHFGAVFQAYYEQISGGGERTSLAYRTTVRDGDLLQSLRQSFDRDCQLQYTTVGIHRDDLALELDGYPVKKLGSQGQKKSILTALKFAQYAYLADRKGVKPLLLLDDVFDKLDRERVREIIRLVSGERFGQVFITDTNREHIDELLRSQDAEYKIFRVTGGVLTAENETLPAADG